MNNAPALAAIGFALGGPPSAPARSVIFREKDLYTGSATEASHRRDRALRRARKQAAMREEVRLARANAAMADAVYWPAAKAYSEGKPGAPAPWDARTRS